MPFIPHTADDIKAMQDVIGIKNNAELFNEIPAVLKQSAIDNQIPTGLSEMALTQLMKSRAQANANHLCFIGAGAYEHHIPAAVWDLTTRGEYMTAYTPYQAEASQGNLQVIYEYQTMMSSVMGMEISNASLYEGASALAEAILMALRLSKKNTHQVLLPKTVHPFYQQAVKTIVEQQSVQVIEVPFELETGRVDVNALKHLINDEISALVIPQPNFFGVLEEVDMLVDLAHDHQLLAIGVCNPLAMALLKPPGQWGKTGVDIACGEGQPLGIPLASGGPYFGFLCTKKSYVRQMPGRIVAKTTDLEGKAGFVLTLQAREQHIRRAKANSNICTNQGLMVIAATIYMSLMGPEGLRRVAALSHQRTNELREALISIPHVKHVFNTPYFHEIVLRLNRPVKDVMHALAQAGIQGGFSLEEFYPEFKNCLLLCATETKTNEDIKYFAHQLKEVLAGRKFACLA